MSYMVGGWLVSKGKSHGWETQLEANSQNSAAYQLLGIDF
jgi:hypothetical protein